MRFGIRDALDTVHAGFELKTGKRAFAFDHEADFFDAAKACIVQGENFCVPVLALCVTGIHAVQVGSKQTSLIAARTCTDFHDDVALVTWILGDQHAFEHFFKRIALFGQGFELHFSQGAHFFVVSLEQTFGLFDPFQGRLVGARLSDNRLKLGALFGELNGGGVIFTNGGQLGFDLIKSFNDSSKFF